MTKEFELTNKETKLPVLEKGLHLRFLQNLHRSQLQLHLRHRPHNHPDLTKQ